MPALGDRTVLLWLVPILLAVHNLEEGLLMQRYLPAAQAAVPAFFRRPVGLYDYPQFVALLIVLTIAAFLIAAFGGLTRPGSTAGYALLAVQATLLLNVASHIGAAFVLRGYSPGLVTALFVNLPFSLWLIAVAWQEHWYSRGALIGLVPIALILHGPVLLGVLAVASRLPIK